MFASACDLFIMWWILWYTDCGSDVLVIGFSPFGGSCPPFKTQGTSRTRITERRFLLKGAEMDDDEKRRKVLRDAYIAILSWPRAVKAIDRLAEIGARLRQAKENKKSPKENREAKNENQS
jgi:hypothetical protein